MKATRALERFQVLGTFSGTLPEVVALIQKVTEHAEKTLLGYLLETQGERLEPVLQLAEAPNAEATRDELLREFLYSSESAVILRHFGPSGASISGKGIPPEAGRGVYTIVSSNTMRLILVYYNGRFVYGLKNPNNQFWDYVRRFWRFPDRRSDLNVYGETYKLEPWEPTS